MRRFTLALTCLLVMGGAWQSAQARTALHMATDGNDSWSGTLARPNANLTDGPKRTLEGARNEVRRLRNRGELHPQGAIVHIQPGRYEQTSQFTLLQQDRMPDGALLIFKGADRDSVVFDGSTAIGGWSRPGRSNSLPFPSRARQHIFVTNLVDQGIEDFGRFGRIWNGHDAYGPLHLLVPTGETRMARWPDHGFVELRSTHSNRADVGPRPRSWSRLDFRVNGFHRYNWETAGAVAEGIDSSGRVLARASYDLFRSGQRVFFENIPEELDVPGEYYLDRDRGNLYYYPLHADYSDLLETRATVLNANMINLDHMHNVMFDSITFENGNWNGISGRAVRGAHFRNIRVSGFHNHGMHISNIRNSTVHQSLFENMGMRGLNMSGGVIDTLTDADVVITESTFTRTGNRVVSAGGAAVSGAGFRFQNNLFLDLPGTGLVIGGAGHVVDNNDFFYVSTLAGDSAGVYTMGRDARHRGHQITNNRFFGLHNHLQNASHYSRVQAVYLDGFGGSTLIEGNHVENSDVGFLIGGGSFNTVRNNVFVTTSLPGRVDDRGKTWAASESRRQTWLNQLQEVNFTSGVWAQRFPELLTFFDRDVDLPLDNMVHNNRIVGTVGFRWEQQAPRHELGTILNTNSQGINLLALQINTLIADHGIQGMSLRNMQERPGPGGSAATLVERDGFWMSGSAGAGPRVTPIGRQNGGGTITP